MSMRSAAYALAYLLLCLLVATNVRAQGTDLDGPTCSNGVPGIQSGAFDDICCDAGCLQCGGAGCDIASESVGLGQNDCCNSDIRDEGNDCAVTGEGPCVIGPTCNNGLPGIQSEAFDDICCDAGCLQCGGAGCDTASESVGLGKNDCCNSDIRDEGNDCVITGEGPCVIAPTS